MPIGSDGTTRKRAERPEVTLAREALSVVLAVRNKIGPWQARAARLRGQQNHGRGETSRDKVQADAHALLVEIEGEQEVLRLRAETLPAGVTRDGHFRDVVKAMTAIASAVGQLAPDRDAIAGAPATGSDDVLNLVVKCPTCGQASMLTILGERRTGQRVDCPLCGKPLGKLDEVTAAARPERPAA